MASQSGSCRLGYLEQKAEVKSSQAQCSWRRRIPARRISAYNNIEKTTLDRQLMRGQKLAGGKLVDGNEIEPRVGQSL